MMDAQDPGTAGMFFGDSFEQEATDDEVKEITALAAKQQELEEGVREAEELLKARKEQLRVVSMEQLPDAMEAAGVTELKLANGKKISVSDFVRCNIKEENKAQAYEYLRGNGAGELIKNEVICNFSKGEDVLARDTVAALVDMGLSPTQKENVHWNTLSAWAKEQLKEGKSLDSDLLGLFVGKQSKIK